SAVALGGLIGAGLFVGSGTAIAAAGPAVVISYTAAGVLLLLAMHLITWMRTRIPGACYLTDFIQLGLGARCGRVAVRVYWCFWVLTAAIEALAGANILAPDRGLWSLLVGSGILMGTAAIVEPASTSLSELEIGFAAIKVGVLVAFVVTILIHQ